MKKSFCSLALGFAAAVSHAETFPAPSPNGVTRPEGYRDWSLIGVAQRTEGGTVRGILGNEVAIKAAREGGTKPWPDGAVLAKIVWKQAALKAFPASAVPGELVHTEFMVKDSAKFASTGGWGFGRWVGEKQEPYGKDANFAQECFGCHGAAKATDWVFTRPVKLP